VRAKIVSLDTYSGHADKNELKQYVEKISGDLKKIICIHGEESQCLAHAETLRAMKPKAEVIVPEYKQVVEISFGQPADDDFVERGDLELVGGGEFDFGFLQHDFPLAAFEVEAVGQFLFGLVDGVFDFHRVDLRNNVE
jgi:hypothetical protein